MIEFIINEETWSVELVSPHDANLYVDGKVCIGTTWPNVERIFISDELSEDKGLEVIRHELCHAYIAATQTHQDSEWSEEDVCVMFELYGDIIASRARALSDALYGTLVATDSDTEGFRKVVSTDET